MRGEGPYEIEIHRGKKIAQRVCEYVVNICRDKLGCGRVDLTVEKPDAMKVYSNLGFKNLDTKLMGICLPRSKKGIL